MDSRKLRIKFFNKRVILSRLPVECNVEITLDNNLQNIEEKMRADGLGEEEIKVMRMMQEELSKE